jgi:hypothetical protein
MHGLKKFAEQHGDIIQWDPLNRAYITTHGLSGIDWKRYKHRFLEESTLSMRSLCGRDPQSAISLTSTLILPIAQLTFFNSTEIAMKEVC